jgi:carbon-monoxide dehydrogenase large subunit
MAVDKVRFAGEAIAIVVADSRYIAEDALELLSVEWEQLPVVVDTERAMQPGAPQLHDEAPGNRLGHLEFEAGDVEEAFAQAAHVFSKRLYNGRHQAAPLETRGSIASHDPSTGDVTLWTSNQMPHLIRTMLVAPLGIPERHLRVVSPAVGGGFGAKSNFFMEDVALICASRLLGRPVKWIEDRAEHLAASTHAKEVICEVDAAVDGEGRIAALRGRYIGNVGAYTVPGPWSMVDTLPAATLLPSMYDVHNVAWEVDGVLTNKCPTAAYRGVGMTCGHNAREVLLDEIGRALDIDPLELRLRNCIPSDPGYMSATGMRYDGGSYEESLRRCAEVADYPAFRKRQHRLRDEGRYIGIGFSPFVEPTGFGTDISAKAGLPATFFDAANVTVEPDGSVTVKIGLHSHGQGHETSFAQVAADTLGVSFESVRVVEGDTETTPYGMGTYASRSAVVGGGAIMRAAREVREKLIQMAAHAMEVSVDDIDLSDGTATVAGVPGMAMSVEEIAGFAYFAGPARPSEIEPALTSTRTYDPAQTYSNGCVVSLVEVDVETGHIQLEKMIAVEDCGTMINPLIVDGQVAGALAQGIGGVLYEELVYSDDGQLLSGSLLDYLYPSTMEVPPIQIEHFQTPSDVTEGGIKGVGEGGTISAPASVLNAVADALSPFGAVIEHTPIGHQDILEMLRKARERAEQEQNMTRAQLEGPGKPSA